MSPVIFFGTDFPLTNFQLLLNVRKLNAIYFNKPLLPTTEIGDEKVTSLFSSVISAQFAQLPFPFSTK